MLTGTQCRITMDDPNDPLDGLHGMFVGFENKLRGTVRVIVNGQTHIVIIRCIEVVK